VPLSALANRYDQFILDLDGCVWVGGKPTPGAVEALEEMRLAGKRLAFATNNAYESGEDLVAQLWRIGVRASLRDVVTAGGAIQHVLAETRSGRTAFVIGMASMHRHVAAATAPPLLCKRGCCGRVGRSHPQGAREGDRRSSS
jgi:ribonucleotide monophosphatase NagD (HAD superfamily)